MTTSQSRSVFYRQLAYLVIAVCGAALDLWSKQAVFAWRGLPRLGNEWWIWEGYFGIETSLNPGALFGMGGGYSGLFAVVSIIAAIAVMAWVFVGGAAQSWWMTIALGAVTGGIVGNLYDRLGLWANAEAPDHLRTAVRDWILLRYGDYTWPNFNVADSLLVCGAIMIGWKAFVSPNENETSASPAAPASQAAPAKT